MKLGPCLFLLLAACGVVPQPADPAVTRGIEAACMADGVFVRFGGRLVLGAVDPTRVAAPIIAAGVDLVCADPERFSADISTVEWVISNLRARARGPAS